MDAAQKSFEVQAQVRQNAEVVKNTLDDLYNWQKEIKDKEQKIQSQQDNNKDDYDMNLPIRSHINNPDSKKLPANSVSSNPASSLNNGANNYCSLLSPSSEKQDTPNDPLELKHKEANEVKDRGNKFVKLSEYDKAIEAYTLAIQLYDNDAVYYSNRALCYLKLERYAECIEDCETAIEIDRLAVKAYYRRMMANESMGNNMDALKDCTTVLLIEPKNSEAKRSLERINERIRKNAQNAHGPNFSPLRSNLVDILPIDKPAYKRSTKPLSRLAIADVVVGTNESKNNGNLTISDDDIDKLFNSNCGYFEEIKGDIKKDSNVNKSTNVPNATENKKLKNSSTPQEKVKEIETEKFPSSYKKDVSSKIEAQSSNKAERPLPPAPNSTAQFYSNWKELTPGQKYHYLKSISLKQLCKILGASFDSDTLTDIINTLHDFYLMEKDANIANTLLEVSKNKQVSILSLLMSNEERKALSEVIKFIKETNSLDAAEEITRNFNLN